MDQAQELLKALWEPFSLFALFGYASLGVLLGAVLGLVLALQLQRRGWLARRKRWHHLLLKLYFLALPLAGGFFGFQGGMLYGSHQQINRHLDAYAPVVQEMADDVWGDFQAYLAAQNLQELQQAADATTVQAVVNRLIVDFLQAQRLLEPLSREGASLPERVALQLVERLRASILTEAVGKMLVDKAAQYSKLDKNVIGGVLDARITQLFQADYLLALLKQQVAAVFKPLYLALLLQVLALLVVVAFEVWLSRYLKQLPTRAAVEQAGASTDQAQVQDRQGAPTTLQR